MAGVKGKRKGKEQIDEADTNVDKSLVCANQGDCEREPLLLMKLLKNYQYVLSRPHDMLFRELRSQRKLTEKALFPEECKQAESSPIPGRCSSEIV